MASGCPARFPSATGTPKPSLPPCAATDLTAPWLIEGAMDRTAFDLYIETQLAPTLHRGRRRHPRQPEGPRFGQSCRRTQSARCLVPLPARLLARSQSDRDGLRQAESASAGSRRPHLRHAMARCRRHLLPVRAARMLELPQTRRLCIRLKARCSSKGRKAESRRRPSPKVPAGFRNHKAISIT